MLSCRTFGFYFGTNETIAVHNIIIRRTLGYTGMSYHSIPI
jgi:hypothetical protein